MMPESLSEKVIAKLDKASELYHRLVLVVAASGAGKTTALRDVAEQTNAPLLNLNLMISQRLLELTERQRALRLPQLLEEVVGTGPSVVLLDNIEVLFDVSLKQDPLRLLQRMSRNRTIVASWNGAVDGQYLAYATPEHSEYRRYQAHELIIVCPEVAPVHDGRDETPLGRSAG